jgi:DNA replication protein DnaC
VSGREPKSSCPHCGDTGWRSTNAEGDRRVTRCECFLQGHSNWLLDAADIPSVHEGSDFSSYNTDGNSDLARARIVTEAWAEQYSLQRKGRGLLLIGPSGVGKTHLSVSMIKELMLKGVQCLFCDYRDLLKRIQNSYNPSSNTSELDILRPVFEAEVLVLDDLGAVIPTGWVWDTVGIVLNTRYNDGRTTIITSNFEDGPAKGAVIPDDQIPARRAAQTAARKETLGDRIGERMRSRLFEMCDLVKVNGKDYRQKFRSATFR